MIKKIIYGGVGFSVTLVIVGYLLTEKPEPYISQNHATNVAEENLYTSDLEIDPRDYDLSGDFEMPKIFDTYHLSEEDLDNLKKSKVLLSGRNNPMMFQENKNRDYSAGASYTWEDVTQETEVEEGHTLGYDINAKGQGGNEITSIESASIEEKFANYAVYPVDKKFYNFSSFYGPRVDPIEKEKEVFHGGIDIAQVDIEGKNVYSILPGAISHIDYNENGYGHFIVVNHGDFTTLYAHLKEEPTLNVGDEVKAGDKLGIVGSTGRSTGPHLHFEVSRESVLIDPKPLLDSIGTGKLAKIEIEEREEEKATEEILTKKEGDE